MQGIVSAEATSLIDRGMKTISIPKISLAGKGSSGSAPAKIKLPDGTKFKESKCSNFDWLKNADTSEMTDMSNMFCDCKTLISIELLFNTASVTNMNAMFQACASLTSLDLSSFDTSAVTNLNHIFYNSNKLTSIILSSFNTSKVKDMGYMFYNCSALLSLELKGFKTSSATYMGYMFHGCSNLSSLDLSSFDTSSVTHMFYMFWKCSNLISLDLSSFDTSSVSRMDSMFESCGKLTSLILGPNFFKTKSVTSIDFSACSAWVGDTVVTSLVTNSYDRAAAGLGTLTLKLSTETKAALTDEQKATITAKGYTIA